MPDSTIHNREELIALRKHVNGCSDEQLMHDLQQDWEHGPSTRTAWTMENWMP